MIDGFKKIRIVDSFPLVSRKWKSNPRSHSGRRRCDRDHLFRLGSCTHTPYLAHHYRQKLVGSLPWGIPMVVVYQHTGAQATNLMVMQDTDKVFIQVRPPCGCNTYVVRLIVLLWIELG